MITARHVLGAAGAVAFLVIQVGVLELREGTQERRQLFERIAAAEAKTAALAVRVEALAGYVATQRPHSSATPPPPEL